MKLVKEVTGWELLNEMNADDWDFVGTIVKGCLVEHKEDAFSALCEKRFPNGTTREEFREYVKANQSLIVGKLGIGEKLEEY